MGDAAAIFGIGILVLAWVGLSIVMPIVALTAARRARREVDLLRDELTSLRRQAAGVPPPPRVVVPPPIVVAVEPPAPPLQEPPPVEKQPPIQEPPPPVEQPAPSIDDPPPPPPAPPAGSAPAASLEEKIALVWFTRIGAGVLLLGVAWFFKYAVDNNWIGPLGRVTLGALAGAGTLVAAELLRPRTRAVYVHVLAGVGLALLYVSAYAAFAFYHLFPASVAFAAVAVVTLLGGALAVHHRGEAILVLALIAGLLSPVLLSTGEDRAAALFGYLFVLTAFIFWAALRMSFRWATWLAIVGPPILFAGWYGKFFDAAPPPLQPTVDAPPETLAGAYFELGRRAAPLVAVAAFFAEWIAVYVVARRRQLATLWPLAILCAAALASHAGFAALLYDRPLALGAVLAALAGASSLLFGRENRRGLLLLPLGASFIVLVATVHGAARPDVIGVMALLALWGAIYARAFLQDQFADGKSPSAGMIAAVGAVGLGVAVAAGVLLLDGHPRSFGLTLVALSLAFALLAVAAGRALVAACAVALSLGGLQLVASAVEPHQHRLIAIYAVWAVVYLGSVAWDVLRRDAAPTALRIAVFSIAGLGFALLAVAQTAESEWLARTGLLAAVGVLDLAFGAQLIRRSRPAASVLLGQALALFAGAVAFALSGATLTLVWAAMAAVVAVLAAAEEDRAWLAGAAALFAVALVHLVSVDVDVGERARELFLATRGDKGALRLPLLFNARSYALGGTALALLVSARALRPRAGAAFRSGAVGFAILGHMLLVGLCVAEVHNAVLRTPTPPPGLGSDEFYAFVSQFSAAVHGAAQTLRMTTTMVLAVYAALLVGIGFGTRDPLHRYLGLGLFALTLGKLALVDIWTLPRALQMLVLLAVGALLLGASFLYARYGKRLLGLLRDDGANASKAALLLFVALAANRADAFDPAQLAFQRALENVNAPGLYRVEIDPEIYRHAHRDDLGDLRIAGADGKEVPWLSRRVAPPEPPVEHAVTVVDPVQLADGSARAVLDLGAPGLKHSEVRLVIAGDGDWFRQSRVEVSSDESSWALLAEGAYLFRVSAEGSVAERTTVTHPVSDARYLRVTLLPSPGPALRITGAVAIWAPPQSQVPLRPLPSLVPAQAANATDARASDYVVDLGAAGVPIADVAFDIADAAFERRALLGAANHKAYWAPVTATLLYRVAKPPQENVRLSGSATRKRYLRLTVYNGDDAPLAIRGAIPSYVAEELVFRAPAAGSYTLYVGGEVAPPDYDLAAVLARSGEQPARDARFGALAANPRFGRPATPPPAPPLSERYKLPIAVGLALLLGLLALWTLRLMRRAR